MEKNNTISWTIVEKREETPVVTSLILKATKEERCSFIAGQYLTVLLPGFFPVEGKSYSISSTPQDEHLTLTVKEMGKFSRALRKSKVGATLITSHPYGFFYPEESEVRDLTFIAGGIGVTPCISIIEDFLTKGDKKNITLFYSNKTIDNIVFYKRLRTLESSYQTFTTHYFITQEKIENPCSRHNLGQIVQSCASGMNDFQNGRITPEFILSHISVPAETDFFLCGSIDFTKSLWTSLKDVGIPRPNIYTEGFF